MVIKLVNIIHKHHLLKEFFIQLLMSQNCIALHYIYFCLRLIKVIGVNFLDLFSPFPWTSKRLFTQTSRIRIIVKSFYCFKGQMVIINFLSSFHTKCIYSLCRSFVLIERQSSNRLTVLLYIFFLFFLHTLLWVGSITRY